MTQKKLNKLCAIEERRQKIAASAPQQELPGKIRAQKKPGEPVEFFKSIQEYYSWVKEESQD